MKNFTINKASSPDSKSGEPTAKRSSRRSQRKGSFLQQILPQRGVPGDLWRFIAGVTLFFLGLFLVYNFFSYFVGNIPGGVPCAAILTCLFYGAISGSGPATTAAVGSMCIPFMVEMGYEKRWSAGLIAVAGGLGVIIPPSIPFVLYSLATGVSTGDLFLAGVIPGILIGLFMMAYAVIFCITKGEDKQRIRAKMSELRGNGFLKLFADSFFALLCPIIVLGGIYSGLVPPTEAALSLIHI